MQAEKLYLRVGHEHRGPAPKSAFLEAWMDVLEYTIWRAEEEFLEALAHGEIYEYTAERAQAMAVEAGAWQKGTVAAHLPVTWECYHDGFHDEKNPWRETVRAIFDTLHVDDDGIFTGNRLANRIVALIEARHRDFFCGSVEVGYDV